MPRVFRPVTGTALTVSISNCGAGILACKACGLEGRTTRSSTALKGRGTSQARLSTEVTKPASNHIDASTSTVLDFTSVTVIVPFMPALSCGRQK